MKVLKKAFFVGSMLLVVFGLLPFGAEKVKAEECLEPMESVISEDIYTIQADVIETKYRVLNKQLQYRHWNRTRGRWVEDHWINI